MRTSLIAAALVVPLLGGAPASAGEWLPGDTHVHTDHSSDGSAPRQGSDGQLPGSTSVATQIAAAERRGLAFLPLTDHRTYDQHWDPQWTSSRLLLIPGEEANGAPHATVIGAVDQVTDGANPPGSAAYRHVQQSIWDVHAQGGSWGTAHPDDGEMNDDGTVNANASAVGIDTVEVLNSEDPDRKIDYAENRWNAGYRFGVVGASDSHFSELDAVQGPGVPTTRVLAESRTERAVLDALRAGRTTVSARPDGVVATLTADTDGDGVAETVGGDERLVPAGTTVPLTVRVERGTGTTVSVYASPGRSAGPVATFTPVLPDQTWTVPVTVPAGDSWYRVEVRGQVGTTGIVAVPSFDMQPPDTTDQLQAITSPVFLSTAALPEPRAEEPLPPMTGTDSAVAALGAAGKFTGFPDVAVGRKATHLVAERHTPGRTTVVYRRLAKDATTEIDLAPASQAARFPRVAARGADVWVTWQDERSGQQPRRPDVYVRHSADGGLTWAPEVRLTDGGARAERPDIALRPDGTPVIAWMDNREGAFDVFAQAVGGKPVNLSAVGKVVDPGVPFDARSPRYPASIFPSVTAAPDGRVAVAWQDNRNDPDPLFTGRSATLDGPGVDGTAPDDWEVLVATLAGSGWSEPVNASADPAAADRHPSAAYDDSGRLHVAWDTKPLRAAGVNVSLRATRSDDGATFVPASTVAYDEHAMSQRPRLSADAGGVRMVWYDTRSADWRWKVFTAVAGDGGWTGPQQLSAAGNGTWPAVDGSTVVFTSDRGARVQRDVTQQVFVLEAARPGRPAPVSAAVPALALTALLGAVWRRRSGSTARAGRHGRPFLQVRRR